jgi:hypothetical protein
MSFAVGAFKKAVDEAPASDEEIDPYRNVPKKYAYQV